MSVDGFENKNSSLLLKRAFILLEDCEFEHADRICEQVLEGEPENPFAYLGKLLAELKTPRKEELLNLTKDFETSKNYKRVLMYAPAPLKKELSKYLIIVKQRVRTQEMQKAQAHKKMKALMIRAILAITVILAITASVVFFAIIPAIRYIEADKKYANGDIVGAYEIFNELGPFLDSKSKAKELRERFQMEISGGIFLRIPYDFGCTGQFVDNRLYLSGKSPTFKEFFEWLTPPEGKFFSSKNMLEVRGEGVPIIVSSDWNFKIPSGQITIIGKYDDNTTFRMTIVS